MKKILYVLVAVLVTSCGCDTDMTTCKFKKGDQVEILNKTQHNSATVTGLHCGCDYSISYYSSMGARRHRLVTEGEIKPLTEDKKKDGYTDKVIDKALDKIFK